MTAGVVDMPDAEYHQHPALSQSGAKLLLPPSCPALFKYYRDNGRPEKRAYDFGHLAHKMVLGVGAELAVIDAPDYRTKAAQMERDEARAAGLIPVLRHEHDVAVQMARVLGEHPVASRLLAPGTGQAEVSLFYTDPDTGIDLRGRLDWLPFVRPGRRMIIPDYKTAVSANPADFAKNAANYGYHMQDSWYSDAAKAKGLDDNPSFVFIVQEKNPPYLVSVIELDEPSKQLGRAQNRRAIQLFKECTETGHWPGYSDDVELVGLPVWYQRAQEEAYASEH